MNPRYLVFIERGGRYGDNISFMIFIGNRKRAYLEVRKLPWIIDQHDFTEFIFWGI